LSGTQPPALDLEQRAAVEVEPEDRQLVLAGPGSGKTEVVAALLAQLVDECALSAADEVLVLSFSRAAVAAVRRRTAVKGKGRITVRTLDSLAARVLSDLDDSDDWQGLSFTKRLRRATQLLDSDVSDELTLLRHLVVDEVQDVVGVRADFLLAVMRQLPDDVGFTMLGDPLQAIYDWQLQEDGSTTTNDDLLAAVRAMGEVREIVLRGQYRARNPETGRLLSLGVRMEACTDTRARAALVEDELEGLPGINGASQLAELAPRWGGTTAVLCRTNGQALVLASELRRAGGDVALQRSMQEAAAVEAIAKVLGEAPSAHVTRRVAEERAAECGVADVAVFTRLLADLGQGRGNDIDVSSIARRVAAGAVPIDLVSAAPAQVVVSTVHRAKGLEFDNVVVVGADMWFARSALEVDIDDEVRTAFVAITRARDRAAAVAAPDTRQLFRDTKSGRWVKGGRERWQTFGFEILGTDTRWPTPVGDPAPQAQTHLASRVEPGDAAELTLNRTLSTLERAVYDVHHEGVLVGRTTEDFGTRLRRRLGPRDRAQRPWPGLDGAVVDGVETMGGLPAPPDRFDGAGRWGLWLSVRLAGLLDLDWKG
jgi:DNA helicase-2/ATP-dependent DNA helicase PcrA